MNRREEREHLIKLLYLKDFHESEELDEQIKLYFEILNENKCSEEEVEAVLNKYNRICEKLPEIDSVIAEASIGWRINRIGKVELQCLRVAIYEIREEEDTPAKVSINEAVELAKVYGGENSYAFVNGILAKMVRKDG